MKSSGADNLTAPLQGCSTGPAFLFTTTGDILIAGICSILLDAANIIISVPLNLLVVLTISFNSSLRRNSDFVLLLLAASDVLAGAVSLSLHLVNKAEHLLGRPSCATATAYVVARVFSAPACVLSVALVSLERALCVLTPYWYLEHVTRRRLLALHLSLWLVWTVVDVVIRFGFGSREGANLVFGGVLGVLLVGNLICSAILIRVANRHESQIQAHQPQLTQKEKTEIVREDKALWNAIYINTTYLATYLPAIIAVVALAVANFSSAQIFVIYSWITTITLFVISANPIILCWRNSRLKREMRKLMRLDSTVHHGQGSAGPTANAPRPTGWN